MAERKAISATNRFEVFKRDGFACQYCGGHPPDVLLHVDHILAVAKGGDNQPDNLITACENCNRGKGARDLNIAPQSLKDKAALIRKKEEQLLGYQQIMEAARDRLEAEIWRIANELCLVRNQRMDTSQFYSIKRFVERLGLHEVLDAAGIAMSRSISNDYNRFKYFCAVCWNKIKRAEGTQ